jgi:DNA replication protein DnaC
MQDHLENSRTSDISEAGIITQKKFSFLKRFESTLTDEEKLQMDAFLEAQKKEREEKAKEYAQKIREPQNARKPILSLSLDSVKKEFKKTWEKNEQKKLEVKTPEQAEFYLKICKYFANDPTSELDFEKGLLIVGNFGVGKTSTMKAFHEMGKGLFLQTNDPFMWFQMANCNDLLNDFESEQTDSGEFRKKYSKGNFYFDDFGTEREASKYGKSNLMQEILENRYLNLEHKTFLTTNLSTGEIQDKYGERVFSRMHQMFNVVVMNGEDFRRKV